MKIKQKSIIMMKSRYRNCFAQIFRTFDFYQQQLQSRELLLFFKTFRSSWKSNGTAKWNVNAAFPFCINKKRWSLYAETKNVEYFYWNDSFPHSYFSFSIINSCINWIISGCDKFLRCVIDKCLLQWVA